MRLCKVLTAPRSKYKHEATVGETLIDMPQLLGLSQDGSMWKTYHEIEKENGEKVAFIKLEGTWFDWKSRKAMAPDLELLGILNSVQKSTNFEIMRSIIPRGAK